MTICRCGAEIVAQRIKTDVPGTMAVTVTICPLCDRRQCRACRTYEPTGTATKCPTCHRAFD